MAERGPVFVADEEYDAGATNRLQDSLREQVERDIAEAEERNQRIKRNRLLRIFVNIAFSATHLLLITRIIIDLLNIPTQEHIREVLHLISDPFLGIFGEVLPTIEVVNVWNKLNLTHVAVAVSLLVLHFFTVRLLAALSSGK